MILTKSTKPTKSKRKRTPLAERKLPTYTRGEEIFHMVSHVVGIALGVVATVLCVVFAAIHQNPLGVISGAVFGASLILLYTMSSIYHGLPPRKPLAKKIFQIFDHCSIFILIAGTYTPFTLVTLMGVDPVYAWWIFGIIWGTAILGVVLNSIDVKRYATFSMICYLVMGWCIVVRANIIPQVLPTAGIIMLILGGISYSVGAIFYGIGKKHKWMHSVFHIAILIGSILQFLCILFYVM